MAGKGKPDLFKNPKLRTD